MIAHTSKFKVNESFLIFLRSKVDNLLEILLDQEKYDLRIRPNYDGEPIIYIYIFFFRNSSCYNDDSRHFIIETAGPRSQLESVACS